MCKSYDNEEWPEWKWYIFYEIRVAEKPEMLVYEGKCNISIPCFYLKYFCNQILTW